jgi:ADP-ribose pyrophosphatase YjhB (NUDIX family)
MADGANKEMTPARIAEVLEALALDGQHYANNTYDRVRYARILELARTLGQADPGAPLLSRITPVTPKVGVDGAVMRNGQILLIRRKDTAQWALPGGACEVGETPREAVMREVAEETGIEMEADNLVGVFDNWMDRKVLAHHLYHIVVRGHDVGGTLCPQPEEILEAGWYRAGALPLEQNFHPGHYSRVLAALSGAIGVAD